MLRDDKRKKIMMGIVMAVAVVLVGGLVPPMDVPYQDTETYYENEPYRVTENYTEAVPLNFEAGSHVKADVIYEHHQIIVGGIVFQDEIVEAPIEVACVRVKNTMILSGTLLFPFLALNPCSVNLL